MRPGHWTLFAGMTLLGAAAGYYKERLKGFKENGLELQANMPGMLQPEAY
ncbi:hypothetical protein HaLaN_23494, partial [Haematococcus lacustris]